MECQFFGPDLEVNRVSMTSDLRNSGFCLDPVTGGSRGT